MKPKRKYKVIAKVSDIHFVKYRTNNPKNFIAFLCRKFPGARYANFFHNREPLTGQRAGSWGAKKGLQIN